jgi:hypothetical protein
MLLRLASTLEGAAAAPGAVTAAPAARQECMLRAAQPVLRLRSQATGSDASRWAADVARLLVPGCWCQAAGARLLMPAYWCQATGARLLVPG